MRAPAHRIRRPGWTAQERDLKAAGAEKIFSEQVSSVAKRVTLAECLAFLRDGDVLTVTKPDRLARSTAELLSIEADLSKRGIGLVVLSMGGERLDTRKPTSKLMLTILAGVATWEREIMLERQREGIAKAKAAGKYKGRPVSIDAAQVKQLRADVGSRGDREASRYCPEFGLPRARIGGANRRAFSRWQLVRPGLQSAGYAAVHIARPIADRDAQPPRALAKTIPHLVRGWLPRPSRHRGSAPPPNKS